MLYSVISGVLTGDVDEARAELARIVTGRTRPFHWHEEGPAARTAMMRCLANLDVFGGAVVASSGRRGQEVARAAALRKTVEELLKDGCEELLIETRGAREDARDKAVILEILRTQAGGQPFSYAWKPKTEPLLWVADALAGAVREHLMGETTTWFYEMERTTGLTLTYL